MKTRHGIVGALLAACVATPAHAQIVIPRIIGGPDIVFDGLLQADANWYRSDLVPLSGNPDAPNDPDYALRRAQVYLSGHSRFYYDWRVGNDLTTGKWLNVDARYTFASGKQFVVAGQFKQPIGLDQLSPGKYTDFMSRAMISNTFALGRRVGVAYNYEHSYNRTGGTGDDAQWSFTTSYFGRELTPRNSDQNIAYGNGFGARGTWAPINTEDQILHFGLGYVNYGTPADSVRLRSRPDADLTDEYLVDTGTFVNADHVSTTGVEGFWVSGPFKLQAEYMGMRVHRFGVGAQSFRGTGGYLSGMWNIAGQGWSYHGGVPAPSVGPASGTGMWQLGLRYDAINLNDNVVNGGRMSTWTAGVNWYWRSRLKVVMNYVAVQSKRDGLNDNPDIAEARIQYYW